MRTVLRVLGWVFAVLLLIPTFAILAAVLLLNTDPGRRLVERLAAQLTSGQVVITGLSGRFPDALRLRHAEVHDAQGAWLTLDAIALEWSPLALLHAEAKVDLLQAAAISVPRLPVSSAPATPAPASSKPFSLPVRVSVAQLHITRATIGAAVAGAPAILALDGAAHLASLQDGDADVTIDRLDFPGSYEVHGRIDPSHLAARLRIAEPAQGWIAQIAKLPDLGAIALTASVGGPQTAEATQLALTAGPLHAVANGTVNLTARAADLDVTATAPAMTPAPGIAWQSVALDAHVHGPFTRPDAAGTLRIAGLSAAGAAIAQLSADLTGNAGAASLRATATGIRIPGPKPGLLAAAPLTLAADARLDDPARPVTFTLTHPLIQAQGHATTAAPITAHLDLTAPDLQPLAAIGGVDLQGRTHLTAGAAIAGPTTNLTLDGTLAITGGQAPIPALLPDATLGITAALTGSDITVTRATVTSQKLTLAATGADKADMLDLHYQLALPDLAALSPAVNGALSLTGAATGPTDDLAVAADITGDIGAKSVSRGPVHLTLNATGLPARLAGAVTAQATLDAAPLDLALTADRAPDGTLTATIQRADWKTLHAEGALAMPPGAPLPDGRVSLRMTRLDDLRPLIGQPIAGSITADADLAAGNAKLDATLLHAGIPGAAIARAVLAARIADPTGRPAVTATLDADGITAGSVAGSAKLAVAGPQGALAIRTTATLTVSGAPATLAGAATLDIPGKTVHLAALTADWHGEALRLLAPARIGFGDGVAVDRLRIGLQSAVLDLAGRFTPALNLQATLRGVTPDLAKPFAPAIDATGDIAAEAHLTGTPAAPAGAVKLTAANLRMRTGPAHALPPATVTASVALAGKSAAVDIRLAAGPARLAVTGRAPLGEGALALRVNGGLDLALLDPLLAPDGRRARGQATVDATVSGATSAPQVGGTLTLAGGELQDFAQGVHVTDIAATIQAAGDTICIASLTGRAGAGVIGASGTVGIAGAMPVDLHLTMARARALASERLTADLDADLRVSGALSAGLAASGKISIQQATINIPEHLPASIAVLPVRIAGAPPPPPPKPGPTVRLDLTLDTPGQIVVRGRGLDATLGGALHLAGLTTAPQVTGGFTMRRGTFSLAGTNLTFNRGRVSFEGAGVTNTIDPSLDFEADSNTTTGTAMLLVTGFASAPKITLASTPALPQDEVLAELLFGRTAAQLGPLQYAEIAAALAQLSGAAGTSSNPLDRVRKGLGLDRLSLGSGSSNTPGSASNSAAPTIEAGRYVANGIYVGAKQGATGSQTEAVVQIDIYKGLKAETTVGSGAGSNSVGLSYQFEY